MYKPIISREPTYMKEIVARLQDKPTKSKSVKWQKKDWRYIVNKKKFRIFSMRIGTTTKYKLASNESSYLWNEISGPGRSSWEMADTGNFLLFRMLIDGAVRTNTYKQRKEAKE